MLKIFSKNRPVGMTEQDKLLYYVDRIVNITIVKTERKDNESVRDTLKDFEKIFRDFLSLKNKNPEKFDALLLSSDFYDRQVRRVGTEGKLSKDQTEATKSEEELQREASLMLFWNAERELKGLTRFLNSFKRIWQAATNSGNEEISRYTIYHLIYILDDLARQESNHIFIKQFLNLINAITLEVIKLSPNDLNPSAYSVASHWYTDIVFNILPKQYKFQIEYLQLFNENLFRNAQIIISRNQKTLFESIVSSLLGIHVYTYYKGSIHEIEILYSRSNHSEYRQLEKNHALRRKVRKLAKDASDLSSLEKLENLLKEVHEYTDFVEKSLQNIPNEEANRNKDEIYQYATSMYKYNELLDVVFAIGSYCLYKRKYDFIKLIWGYKQPGDADGVWVGHDIVPNSLDEVMRLFFKRSPHPEKYSFHEDHHGTKIYNDQYLILLMARVLDRIASDDNGRKVAINNYNYPDLPSYLLSDIKHSVKDFNNTIQSLKKNKDIHEALGFNDTEQIFGEILPFFFETLKIKAEEKLKNLEVSTKICQEKIEEFKDQVVAAFHEGTVLRNIFKRYKLFENKTSEWSSGLDRFGINIVTEKGPYFKEWHISYGNWGEQYGRDLAFGEDRRILDRIIKLCTKHPITEFENLLKTQTQDGNFIIFSTTDAVYDYFHQLPDFIPRWREKKPLFTLPDYAGSYKIKNIKIAVFSSHYLNPLKQIVIIETNNLGTLIQFSPIEEDEEEKCSKDIFFMDVQAFSENEELTKELIDKAPDWLKKIGTPDQQRKHLYEKALVRILERFEFRKHPEFKGYLFDSTEFIIDKT